MCQSSSLRVRSRRPVLLEVFSHIIKVLWELRLTIIVFQTMGSLQILHMTRQLLLSCHEQICSDYCMIILTAGKDNNHSLWVDVRICWYNDTRDLLSHYLHQSVNHYIMRNLSKILQNILFIYVFSFIWSKTENRGLVDLYYAKF